MLQALLTHLWSRDDLDIAAGPIATVELPFRVPAGLHGNWFSSG